MFVEGSKFKTGTAEDLKRQIDAAGSEQTILCSDLGQTGTISPLEGFRRGVRMCIRLGYNDAHIRQMISTNTARMLGIEADVNRSAPTARGDLSNHDVRGIRPPFAAA
jgi:adenine deaminase